MITIELTPAEIATMRAITEFYQTQLKTLPPSADVRTLHCVAAVVDKRLELAQAQAGTLPVCEKKARRRHTWAN